jgi:outer membrane protein assembly factor BamB
MTRNRYAIAALSLAGVLFCSGMALAQGGAVGNWTATGNDPGHSGWQKAENSISKETAGTSFKYLWKIQLGAAGKDAQNFTEPLLAPRLINSHGFKDLVLWASTDTLYAVDSELGVLLWKKSYAPMKGACGPRNLNFVMEPPVVINFGARRAPGAPIPPPPPPPPTASQRRVGMSTTGGFGLKGIYVLAGDGMIHEQVLTTGADWAPTAPAVKFLPAGTPVADLDMMGKTIFTSSGECASGTKGIWSIDVASSDYKVSSLEARGIQPIGLAGVAGAAGADGVIYAVTGAGASAAEGVHANSVMALDAKSLAVSDWYTPAGEGTIADVMPIAFTYKGRHMVAAPGKNGSYVLLDGAALGGANHQTALAETPKIAKPRAGAMDSLAAWQDAEGTAWVLASVSSPMNADAKFGTMNGTATHGAIVAFKVADEGGSMTLTPEWVSRDLVNPAPPVIANGTVVALSQGDASTHARLYVLDASSGKELYNSGDAIPTYAHHAGLSVGDGHAFFTTHDNVLYSFGIGIEH